jgi:hypothetical protein
LRRTLGTEAISVKIAPARWHCETHWAGLRRLAAISRNSSGSEMTDKTMYVLGDDLPKRNPWEEDRLGYAPVAERISRVIINLAAPNGYVIGLHGQWGSGKSTFLNFVVEYLEKHNAEHEGEQVIRIDFRPWIVSGHHDLVAAFFKVLSEKLGSKDSRWRRFLGRTFPLFRGTTDDLVDAAASIALSVDGGVVSGIASKFAKRPLDKLLGRFLEDPSLEKAYNDLREKLARSGKRFLVTIDDIDRLEAKDVRSIMQMVKSIGCLPNVVYLLAYDREIVWSAMDQGIERAGPRFGEKIVQQEIEVPHPPKHLLLEILYKEISFLVGASQDSLRWHCIVTDGIHRWIRSPRDVVRFSNALKFTWPALKDEIDPVDLLAIEGLRLFDECAFNWIRDQRRFLLKKGLHFLVSAEIIKASVEDLKRRIPEADRFQILRIMSVLFPQATNWFEVPEHFGKHSAEEITMRRGIGSDAGYDAYFWMHPSSDAIPKVVIDDLMSRLEDADGIEAIIRSYIGNQNSLGESMVAKLLDELCARYHGLYPAQPTQALLDALFRVGEEIIGIDRDGNMPTWALDAQISLLVQYMLEQWGPQEAGKRLIEAFKKGASPAFLAEIYGERGLELGVFPPVSPKVPLISRDDFTKLGEILLGKIHDAVADKILKNAPYYYNIIWSWAQLENSTKVKAWLDVGIMDSAEFMAKVSRGLVGPKGGPDGRQYIMSNTPPSEFYDLQMLVDVGNKHLRSADLTDDQRSRITAIVQGAERRLSQQPPDDATTDTES